jgi:hypothetical protein
MQPRFFDLDKRYGKLNERDPLVMLNKLIDWVAFALLWKRLEKNPEKATLEENLLTC